MLDATPKKAHSGICPHGYNPSDPAPLARPLAGPGRLRLEVPMPYRDQPARPAPHRGRGGRRYLELCAQLRRRVRLEALPCWFYGKPGHEACPRIIDLALPSQHRYAFTAHHLDRLMDGGPAVPRAHRMVPAHRACNARDGLIAQNARRRMPALPDVLLPPTDPRGQHRLRDLEQDTTTHLW